MAQSSWEEYLAQKFQSTLEEIQKLNPGRDKADPSSTQLRPLPIPQHLREYAGLQDEVVIVGLGTHLEIWDLKTWQTKRDEFESRAANAEHWASLGV